MAASGGGGGGGASPVIFEAPQLALASSTAVSTRIKTRWIVDSGAFVNIVSSPLLLDSIDDQIDPIHISTMTGTIVQSAAAGPCTIVVIDPVSRATSYLTLKRAYFVSDAAFNLLSVQRLLDQGVDTAFDKRHPLFNGALIDASKGMVICRIQHVGASLLITCPAVPLSDIMLAPNKCVATRLRRERNKIVKCIN